MVAYHGGNAANVAAAATTSQTSFASQKGPMVLIATRRSVSLLPTTMWSIPTPKSKPSSTKNPAHRTAMSTNQKVFNPITVSQSDNTLADKFRGNALTLDVHFIGAHSHDLLMLGSEEANTNARCVLRCRERVHCRRLE